MNELLGLHGEIFFDGSILIAVYQTCWRHLVFLACASTLLQWELILIQRLLRYGAGYHSFLIACLSCLLKILRFLLEGICKAISGFLLRHTGNG